RNQEAVRLTVSLFIYYLVMVKGKQYAQNVVIMWVLSYKNKKTGKVNSLKMSCACTVINIKKV
ncbi:hypothetical protein CGI07_24545, partial [Vibrio parahaemolyticus]